MTKHGSGYMNGMLVCLDSYQKGNPRGWIHTAGREPEAFESLTQLLITMEALLEAGNMPQSYTKPRTFSPLAPRTERDAQPPAIRRGEKATFEVRVLFRQHTSWQGVITWLERNAEQSFRSVLELVLLMDSALRSGEGCDAAS